MLAAAALSAPLAHAGSYDVYSCTIDGGYFPNNAWVAGNNPAGNAAYGVDASCPKSGDPLAVSLAANTAYSAGTFAALWLYTPAQTAITDFKVTLRHYWYAPPLPNYPTERTYTLASFGDIFYSGTGLFRQADQDAIWNDGHRWYGYRGAHQSGAADTGAITITRAASKIATAAPSAPYLTVSTGCWTDDNSACSLGDGSGSFIQVFGSRVTITDSTAPALMPPTAGQGLLAPGTRSGDEPVAFSASDNVGIRRAELVDVTDAAHQSVVAGEDYNSVASDAKTRCDFTRPRPCPDLTKETLAAPTAIAGKRTLLLRVTDAAGNQTVSPPFAISARGPVNGSGGGDGARLIAGFPGHTFRGRGKARRRVGVLRPTKTVGWGHGATVRGVLRNASGQPVAGAELRLLVRELRLGAHYVDRGVVTTAADGRFAVGTRAVPRGAIASPTGPIPATTA
jgi:hypothetical protein